MDFIATRLPDARLVRLDPRGDERGAFARLYCARDFEAAGLPAAVVQTNLTRNARRGTLRGLHFQEAPHAEAKLVQCVRGRMYDVAVDLRPHSPTFRQWAAFELSADGCDTFFIPEGFAHGYQTLADDTWVLYHMFAYFVPEAAAGVRWDDSTLAVDWPIEEAIISPKDHSLPTVDQWIGRFRERA